MKLPAALVMAWCFLGAMQLACSGAIQKVQTAPSVLVPSDEKVQKVPSIFAAYANAPSDENDCMSFEEYIMTWNKVYKSEDEYSRHERAYNQKCERVIIHNKMYSEGKVHYKDFIYKDADFTAEVGYNNSGGPEKYGISYEEMHKEIIDTATREEFGMTYEEMADGQMRNYTIHNCMDEKKFIKKYNNENVYSHECKMMFFLDCMSFEEFIVKYNKVYTIEDDYSKHEKAFRQDCEKMIAHNKLYYSGKATFKLSTTHSSDRPMECMSFQKFIVKFNRVYIGEDDYSKHEEVYRNRCESLLLQNKEYYIGKATYKDEVDDFFDWSTEDVYNYEDGPEKYGMTYEEMAINSTNCMSFEEFIVKYNREYKSENDRSKHEEVFNKSCERMIAHNKLYLAGNEDWRRRMSNMFDWTLEDTYNNSGGPEQYGMTYEELVIKMKEEENEKMNNSTGLV